MADFMNQPLDEKTLQALLVPLLLHKFQADQQANDPMRKAQLEHLQTQTQQMKDANDPQKLLDALSGNGSNNPASASKSNGSSTVFLPNGSYVAGSGANGMPNYVPPTEYNLDSNPYSANMGSLTRTSKGPSDPNQDVLIRGKNPATGNPWFGNQLPDWASADARTAFAADRAGLPGTGETTPKANPGATGKANSGAGAGGMDPQRLVQMVTMAKTMTAHGFSKELSDSILEKYFPELQAQKDQAAKDKKQTEADIRQSAAPAPAGLYLDAQGVPYSPIYGSDINKEQGGAFYRQNSPQQKVFESTGMVNNHVDATLENLQSIAKGDNNRFQQLLKTKLSQFQNDPQVNTLINQLGPATAIALSQAYAAASPGMRGGAQMAKMFEQGVYSPGDNLGTVLNKLKTLEGLSLANAKHNNLHPSVVDEIQQRLDTIDALKKSSGAGAGSGSAAGGWTTTGGIQWRPKGQ